MPFGKSQRYQISPNESVTINIGLMLFDENVLGLEPNWGKKLPIKRVSMGGGVPLTVDG